MFTWLLSYKKTVVSVLLILILCLLPAKDLQKIDLFHITYQDLVVHFGMFFFFSFLLFIEHKRISERSSSFKTAVLCMSIGTIFSMGTETAQWVLSSLNRSASFGDFFADIMGLMAGIVAGYYYNTIA